VEKFITMSDFSMYPGPPSTMYRTVMEETRWGAVSPGSEWSISTLRADFVSFTSKCVRISPNLLTPCADPLFTTSNGSHTRCEAVFPGIEVSISTLQCISILQCKIGPPFS
jgi:hypothetical protein